MKKVLIAILLVPIAIFAVGVVALLVGKGMGFLSPQEPTTSVDEKETPQVETTAKSQPVKPSSVSKPAFTYATVYYDANGSTRDEIRADMERSKSGSFLAGHDGATTAEMNIKFATRQSPGLCETVLTRFDVSITYTYPRWASPPVATTDVVAKWNSFIVALKVHEEGHSKIEAERTDILFQKLVSLPGYKTCEEFDRAYKATANAHDNETKLIEAQYDKDTQGGRLQGVSF